MIGRYLAATIGGSVITLAMLLGMNEIAEQFKERDPTRYFSVVDFVALPKDRRPSPPPVPAVPPERPRIDVRTQNTRLPVQIPSVDQERVSPPPLIPDPDAAVPARRP